MVALGLAAASPPQGKAGEQPNQAPQPQQTAAQKPPPPEADDTKRLNAACKEGHADRDSDLCAQWYAADSAYEASIWTRRTGWITLLGLIVGAITMGAAICAALFAKDAADHTKRSADAAEKQLATADRPHLLLESVTFGPLVGLEDGAPIPLSLKYVNHGRGPGWMKEWGVKVTMGPHGKAPVLSFAEDTFQPFKVAWSLHPQGGYWYMTASDEEKIPTDPGCIDKIRSGEWALFVGLLIRYRDADRVIHTNLTVHEYERRNDRLIPIDHPCARYD